MRLMNAVTKIEHRVRSGTPARNALDSKHRHETITHSRTSFGRELLRAGPGWALAAPTTNPGSNVVLARCIGLVAVVELRRRCGNCRMA